MPTRNELLANARELGRENGHNAASWYFDGNTAEETYKAVHKGIMDGDPMILDTFPSSPLSGEFADSMTPHKLYDLLDVSESQLRNWESTGELDELCQVFEEEFNTAVHDHIAKTAEENLPETNFGAW